MDTPTVKPARVVIVGAGIAGPTLALLLKQKGYFPVVVEKVRDMGNVGIALSIHPNGMKVLNRAGLALDVVNGPPSSPPTLAWDDYTNTGEFLGGPASSLLAGFIDRYGWPVIGVTRTRLQTLLIDKCRQSGIPVHTGWRLASWDEVGDGIVARAEDGRELHADFIVGTDGLRSRTREILLQKRGVEVQEPMFTGIVVRGGQTPTPAAFDTPAIRIYYGATTTVISHTLEDGMSVWGLNYFEKTPVKESWSTVLAEDLQKEIDLTLEKLEGWAKPVREMVSKTTKMMSIGLYDRPELPVEQWYYGRGIVVGDAAHPTTPHVGQGANQGLVDAWHLSQLLPSCDEQSAKSLDRAELETIFHNLAAVRQGPTAMIVERSREQGKLRVVTDKSPGAKERRDDLIRSFWRDQDTFNQIHDMLYNEPFEDKEGFAKMMRQRQE
ncbi:hypothetical protein B0T26DRAFT_685653 [Lasiosphaeria miniovina]|uniref:FAD-binding domain-containing protein n=1 Tax=Lasiosphaeria miniovina TaxID=1954250 RepID=A0AA40ECZ1_9PEZI|nr:uncharacterized protein B0T26DRAFT_685653 [Lasiosphaeria miniovina]KAK0733762.1 hypothetical protein B0T26DRAFT_685653 [Lasiosphaeria miniovina]